MSEPAEDLVARSTTTQPTAPRPLPQQTGFYLRFLRANGSVSIGEWVKLSADAQDALECAGEILGRERAGMIAEQIVELARDQVVESAVEAAGRVAVGGAR